MVVAERAEAVSPERLVLEQQLRERSEELAMLVPRPLGIDLAAGELPVPEPGFAWTAPPSP